MSKNFSPVQAMNEKFFPAIELAHQNYLQTGTIRSACSSFFAFNEDAMKKVSLSPSTEITLREEINPAQLQAATDKAIEVCPYIAFDISKRGDIVHFHKNNLPLVVHKAGTIKEFGTDDNNRHYSVVEYDGAKIIFTVSHILTDATGIFYFVQAVLDFYFGEEKTFYQGANKIDFAADLMAQDFPLPEDYEPKDYKLEKLFVPPEINSSESGTMIETFAEIPTQKFKAFCKKYNISAQIALSILLAKAVQKTHPQNEKIISVRGPVNTRIALNLPNTFQNASIPHIFLNIEPRWLEGEFPAEALKSLKEDIACQCSYENLAAFTNKLRKFFTTKDISQRNAMGMAYKRQTDVFASYLGNILTADTFAHIKLFRQKISAAYPLMTYAYKCGEVLVFQIIQSFDNPLYAENLLKVINEL